MTHAPGTGSRERYGAVELKDSMQLYWMTGLGLAIAIHLAVIFSYKLAGAAGPDEHGIRLARPVVTGTWIPNPINPGSRPVVNYAEHGARRVAGVPVPVPEPVADTAKELAPNDQFIPEGTETGGETGGEFGGAIEPGPEEVPDTFTPVEEMPRIIKRVPPDYPELAIKAGLEGTVYLKFWVDKTGKPRDISVARSTADIFNEPAITAAKQFVYVPAYMNAGPVAVWMTMPFRFRLANRN